MLESELVRYLNGLHQKEILTALGGTSGAATTTFAEGNHRAQLAGGLLLITLHRLASGHAGSHQRAKLHDFGAWELERVEVGQQNLEVEGIL